MAGIIPVIDFVALSDTEKERMMQFMVEKKLEVGAQRGWGGGRRCSVLRIQGFAGGDGGRSPARG